MKKSLLILFGIFFLGTNINAQNTGGCESVNPPFYTDFEDGDINCWTMIDSNNDNLLWHIDETQATIGCSAPGDKVVSMNYNFNIAMEDWLFSPSINLQPGVEYTFSFSFGNDGSATNVENLEVFLVSDNTVNAAIETLMFTDNAIANGCSFFQTTVNVDSVGIYYLAFMGKSDANQNILMIDDVYLGEGTLSVDDNLFQLLQPQIYYHNHQLTISLDRQTTSNAMISISSMLGQEIFNSELLINNGQTRMELTDLTAGIYLVSLKIDDQLFVEKIKIN